LQTIRKLLIQARPSSLSGGFRSVFLLNSVGEIAYQTDHEHDVRV